MMLPKAWIFFLLLTALVETSRQHVLRELPSSPVPASCCTVLLEAFRKFSVKFILKCSCTVLWNVVYEMLALNITIFLQFEITTPRLEVKISSDNSLTYVLSTILSAASNMTMLSLSI